jgi:hypothetical protein
MKRISGGRHQSRRANKALAAHDESLLEPCAMGYVPRSTRLLTGQLASLGTRDLQLVDGCDRLSTTSEASRCSGFCPSPWLRDDLRPPFEHLKLPWQPSIVVVDMAPMNIFCLSSLSYPTLRATRWPVFIVSSLILAACHQDPHVGAERHYAKAQLYLQQKQTEASSTSFCAIRRLAKGFETLNLQHTKTVCCLSALAFDLTLLSRCYAGEPSPWALD